MKTFYKKLLILRRSESWVKHLKKKGEDQNFGKMKMKEVVLDQI